MSAVEAATNLPGLEPDLGRARELAASANVVPVRYRFIDDCETPVSAFLKLRGDGPAFLLESAEQGRLGRWSFLGFRPRSVLRWSDGKLFEDDRVSDAPDPYAAAAEYLGRYEIAEPDELPPFAGGAVGFFGYDLVRTVEPLEEPNPDPIGLPDMALMITDVLVAFDHQRHEVTLIANAFVEDGGIEEAYARAVETIGEVRERLRDPVPTRVAKPVAPSLHMSGGEAEDMGIDGEAVDFQPNMSRDQFEATVARIIEYVHAGDAFQVVPSQRLARQTFAGPFAVYRALRRLNPSPYLFFLELPDNLHLIGSSPEVLVRLQGRQAEVRPLAGTRPRGKDGL
jgi:anthranilate synthase component 1